MQKILVESNEFITGFFLSYFKKYLWINTIGLNKILILSQNLAEKAVTEHIMAHFN